MGSAQDYPPGKRGDQFEVRNLTLSDQKDIRDVYRSRPNVRFVTLAVIDQPAGPTPGPPKPGHAAKCHQLRIHLDDEGHPLYGIWQ